MADLTSALTVGVPFDLHGWDVRVKGVRTGSYMSAVSLGFWSHTVWLFVSMDDIERMSQPAATGMIAQELAHAERGIGRGFIVYLTFHLLCFLSLRWRASYERELHDMLVLKGYAAELVELALYHDTRNGEEAERRSVAWLPLVWLGLIAASFTALLIWAPRAAWIAGLVFLGVDLLIGAGVLFMLWWNKSAIVETLEPDDPRGF